MTTIKKTFGTGGSGLVPGAAGVPTLAETGRDIADDLTELRTQFNALLAKLDADGGVTDTNYAATLTPAALKTIKG